MTRKMEYGPFKPMRGARGQAEAVQSEDSVAEDNSRFETQPRQRPPNQRDEVVQSPKLNSTRSGGSPNGNSPSQISTNRRRASTAARDEAIRKPAGYIRPSQLRRARRQARFPEGRATPDTL